MANDKDFKVKNGIQPTVYHEGVGTVVSGSEGYYLAGASYTQGYTQSQSTDPRGPVFKTDGTKMYLVTITTVYQYSLSTAWDVTTASYESKSFNASSQDSQPYGARFKPDGTKMFIVGATNDSIFQYSLSTAWDVSTASYDSVTLSVNSQDTTPTALAFKPDGTRMYITGNQNDSVYQYSLSTAWDLSTASYDSVSLSVSSQESFPDGLDFNSTGTNMFVSGAGSDSVYQYTLSTAWDLSTASYSNISFSIASQSTTPYGLVFGDSGTKMYITNGNSPYNILQYSTSQSSQTLDLSSGSVFEITPTSDIQVGLSNPAASGTVSSATLLLDGAVEGYSLTGAAYDSKSFSVTSQETTPRAIAFKTDGTKVYIVGNTSDTIYQYSLSTAWDISTASYDSVSFSTSGQESYPTSLVFKSDGLKMFLMGQTNDRVYSYTLSSAWDVSTASYDSVFLTVATQVTTPRGLSLKSDGTVMVIGDNADNVIHQYTLSTGWDLSTASYASKTFTPSGFSTYEHLFVNPDGTKLFALDAGSNEVVKEFSLSTAWDISTASSTGNSLDVTSEDGTMHGLVFKPDGTKLYMLGNTGDNIYQYTIGSAYTVTYDSTLQWGGGTAPDSPAANETDVLTFTTRDGGTTYQAVQAIDGAK